MRQNYYYKAWLFSLVKVMLSTKGNSKSGIHIDTHTKTTKRANKNLIILLKPKLVGYSQPKQPALP